MDQVLIILTGLFGGLNVLQLVFWQAEKKKANASAEAIEIENQKKQQEMRRDEVERLYKQLDELTDKWFAMQKEANEAINQVAAMKAEVTYLKGLRCYNTLCTVRIRHKESELHHLNTQQS
ncbi:hypothetical protein ACOMSG_13175 [Macellibacteroides fermentans]|uniref:Uncharacterized protein n=1 Tax=bioreactor metagenome TaxID=1076179 RepID=A0A644V6Y1_9ZZZZ|nr:hypothetical protein [Bacteroidota bacterium]